MIKFTDSGEGDAEVLTDGLLIRIIETGKYTLVNIGRLNGKIERVSSDGGDGVSICHNSEFTPKGE